MLARLNPLDERLTLFLPLGPRLFGQFGEFPLALCGRHALADCGTLPLDRYRCVRRRLHPTGRVLVLGGGGAYRVVEVALHDLQLGKVVPAEFVAGPDNQPVRVFENGCGLLVGVPAMPDEAVHRGPNLAERCPHATNTSFGDFGRQVYGHVRPSRPRVDAAAGRSAPPDRFGVFEPFLCSFGGAFKCGLGPRQHPAPLNRPTVGGDRLDSVDGVGAHLVNHHVEPVLAFDDFGVVAVDLELGAGNAVGVGKLHLGRRLPGVFRQVGKESPLRVLLVVADGFDHLGARTPALRFEHLNIAVGAEFRQVVVTHATLPSVLGDAAAQVGASVQGFQEVGGCLALERKHSVSLERVHVFGGADRIGIGGCVGAVLVLAADSVGQVRLGPRGGLACFLLGGVDQVHGLGDGDA